MNKELMFTEKTDETERGLGYISKCWFINKLWKFSNDAESVYVNISCSLYEDGQKSRGAILFESKGKMRFDTEKGEWYTFKEDIDFFDENDKEYHGSSEFEKEVLKYVKENMSLLV